jgi:hypothetical protein
MLRCCVCLGRVGKWGMEYFRIYRPTRFDKKENCLYCNDLVGYFCVHCLPLEARTDGKRIGTVERRDKLGGNIQYNR